jgi:hypothetical protein
LGVFPQHPPLSDMQAEAPYRYSQVVNSGRG